MAELKIYEKYEKLNKIGEGCWSKVYKAQNRATKEFVAIKEVSLLEINNKNAKTELETEIKVMKIFNYCPNSVKLYETFEDNDYIYLVMELCDGDLTKYLNKSKNGFNIPEIRIIMKQLNNIVYEMRKKDMTHNDLKIENILIKFKENSKEFEVKLSDYFLSLLISTTKDLTNNEWGIKPYNEGTKEEIENLIKVDLLMIGNNIYTLLFDEIYKSFDDMKEDIDEYIDDKDLKDLLDKLLVEDSRKRIGWEEYFKHKFFNINKFEYDKVVNIVKNNN